MYYLLPGLGADARVFRRLRLPGPHRVLPWLPLASPTEPLTHYAARLAALVPERQPCWLVGVSFGGVVAQEIGRLRPLARVVLVSSLASPAELPGLLRLAGRWGLWRLVPFGLLARLPRLARWFFGTRGRQEFQLLSHILRATEPQFARWATGQLLSWRGPGLPGAVRLHGTRDRLLPARGVRINYPLAGAGHFGIVSHARQVSAVLAQLASTQKGLPLAEQPSQS